MQQNIDKIKEFWQNQAILHGNLSTATSPDSIAFKMEIDTLIKNIPTGAKILDIGCGNGAKAKEIIKNINCQYFGIDYSNNMINQALSRFENELGGVQGVAQFRVGDILNLDDICFDEFDIIITSRCLINLTSIQDQLKAIKNIHLALKPNGIYLMMENFIEPLQNLNNVRSRYNLEPIEIRWHNLYINQEQFLDQISNLFSVVKIDNFASTYYLISRTLNAILNLKDNKVDYNSTLNELAAKLPSIGDFSPEKLIVLKKV